MILLNDLLNEKNKNTLELIYQEYRRLMYYIACQILHNQQDSEDVMQEVFLKLAQIPDKIEDPYSKKTKSLVCIITENKAIDLYRRKRARTILPFEDEVLSVPETVFTEQMEIADELTRAILLLPPRYREVLMLRYAHGYENAEIAPLLSLSRENVKKIIQRARKKLEEILQQ